MIAKLLSLLKSQKMLWKKVLTIALLLVSACIAVKEEDSIERSDDSFYDSRGEKIRFL